ncbi:alpha/beta fold hydrolase [Stackebrandtia soli]|uniref:alpha/beta fold hydrolase n=1 Tax=Stackebrandtia soli TaxID=1892856 RepID=UPI0039EBF543
MTTRTLTRDEGTLTYEISGPADGRLVVCAHGLGDTRQTYRLLVPALAEAGYRVATIDLRGAGDSSVVWSRYGTIATAGDLAALIRELGGPAVVIGHSFAAGSIAHLAVDSPELVSALVMIGPAVRHDKPSGIMGLAAKAVTSNPTLWTMYYKSLYPGAKPDDFAQYLRDLKASLRRPGRINTVRKTLDALPGDAPARLGAVTAPALIVMGDTDGDFADPTGEAHRIGDELGGAATVTVMAGSGHYPHVDNAEDTIAATLAFLKGH